MAISSLVTYISECSIKPKHEPVQDSKSHLNLTPWDLPYLSRHYVQQGLIYANSDTSLLNLEKLKDALSHTLMYFYPLAGQFVTKPDLDNPSTHCYTSVDCKKGPGAKFIHAVSKKISSFDILSPKFNPIAVNSLFDHNGALNNDAHFSSFLTVQVTELLDGFFIGCSMNHAVVDGTSFWHFVNSWNQIYNNSNISQKPIYYQRSELVVKEINIPIIEPSMFVVDQRDLIVHEFRFSKESTARLKAKANAEIKKIIGEHHETRKEISLFQAVAALVWRAVTKARNLIHKHDEPTVCAFSANERGRLSPPLSPYYFGNCEQSITAITTVHQLVHECNLGQVAALLNKAVAEHDNEQARGWAKEWLKSRQFYSTNPIEGLNGVLIGSSPRFNMYGNEFGLGRPVGVRSGYGNMFDGKVAANEGCQGLGSMSLEICLEPKIMVVLESDQEFMAFVS